MMHERAGDQLVARIGFAERWLERAKRHLGEGDVTRSALTLVLAGAEVRHALEVAGMPGGHAGIRRQVVASAGILTLLMAAVTLAVVLPQLGPAAGVPPNPGPPVVHLAAQAGSMLALVPAPESAIRPSSVPPAPHRSAPSRQSLRVRGQTIPATALPARSQSRPGSDVLTAPVPAPAPSLTAPEPLPAPEFLATPAAPGVVQAAPPAPFALTTTELIELVLAAERTLRDNSYR